MATRGLQKLKDFLGEEQHTRTQSKRARDVVPVLAPKQKATPAGSVSPSSSASAADTTTPTILHASVLAYLQERHTVAGTTNKLQSRQVRLLTALAHSPRTSDTVGTASSQDGESRLTVKRAVLDTVEAMVDTVAIAALQRHAVAGGAGPATAVAAAATASAGGGAGVFVLAEDEASAKTLKDGLERHYGLRVLFLDGAAARFPDYPAAPPSTVAEASATSAASTTPSKANAKGKPRRARAAASMSVSPEKPSTADITDVAKRVSGGANEPNSKGEQEEAVPMSTASLRASTVVTVASPAGLLAVDRRSAIWKFIGAFIIALQHTAKASALLRVLGAATTVAAKGEENEEKKKKKKPAKDDKESNAGKSFTAVQLSNQRWSCLGHVPVVAVLATDQSALTSPALDWLTTLRPVDGAGEAAMSAKGGSTAFSNESTTITTTGLGCVTRSQVRVHYAVAEGLNRFTFLFGLLNGLRPHRGLVVHVATKQACAFLYNALYALLDELPSFIHLMTDYEGESGYSALNSPQGRQALCDDFDAAVEAASTAKTAPVLLSCYGLVPRRGSVFLQYDIVPDLPNYTQFVSDVLTPGAAVESQSVLRETHTRRRTRSVSPPPPPPPQQRSAALAAKKAKKGASAGPAATEKEQTSLSSPSSSSVRLMAPAMYQYILLLFRPNETNGALRHLNTMAKKYNVVYTPLSPMPSVTRYRLIAEKLQSMHKKLFVIANTAYFAYKETMIAYCTIGPHDVYSSASGVNLQHVAEEFGFVEVPLLDLRLKDTAFRPKEDYFKAARRKQAEEQRVYRRFADANIAGEGPEEHAVETEESAL